MKLEILSKRNGIAVSLDKLQLNKEVLISRQDDECITSIIYEIQDNNLNSAKILSGIYDQYVNLQIDCYVATNDAAEFFNLELYPLFNKFERNLRKLIYILAIKSDDNAMKNFASKIEKLDFNALMNYLFNKKTPLKAIKNGYSNEFLRQSVEQDISNLSQKSLWSYFVAEDSFLSNKYKEIINHRDSVMHAENMNYKKYLIFQCEMDNANKELEFYSTLYMNQSIYMTTPRQKSFYKYIKWLFKI